MYKINHCVVIMYYKIWGCFCCARLNVMREENWCSLCAIMNERQAYRAFCWKPKTFQKEPPSCQVRQMNKHSVTFVNGTAHTSGCVPVAQQKYQIRQTINLKTIFYLCKCNLEYTNLLLHHTFSNSSCKLCSRILFLHDAKIFNRSFFSCTIHTFTQTHMLKSP